MRIGDWSSDVCSSDLEVVGAIEREAAATGDVCEVATRRRHAATVEQRIGPGAGAQDVALAVFDEPDQMAAVAQLAAQRQVAAELRPAAICRLVGRVDLGARIGVVENEVDDA